MDVLNFLLQRYSDNGDSTQGLLFQWIAKKLKFFSHAIEDQHQEVKVAKETRIPAGIYELVIRKEETPLTLQHRKDYGDWFTYHIEIIGIPGFKGVYVHVGNTDDHTEGCLLLNDTANNNQIEAGAMSRSKQAVQRFYELVYPHLESGKKAFIEVRDELALAA